MNRLLIQFIVLYQKFVSPWFPARCRFHPTCSQYARESLAKHSAVKAITLIIKRLLKCHPYHEGGFDPVP